MPTRPSTAPSSPRSQISPDSDWIDWVARAGLVAYGVVYVLIGWLAVQLALGDRSGAPSSSGALRELAQQPFGDVLIWIVSIGMFLLALWQLQQRTEVRQPRLVHPHPGRVLPRPVPDRETAPPAPRTPRWARRQYRADLSSSGCPHWLLRRLLQTA